MKRKCDLCFDGRLTMPLCPMCGRIEGETAAEIQARAERVARPSPKTGPFRKWTPPFVEAIADQSAVAHTEGRS